MQILTWTSDANFHGNGNKFSIFGAIFVALHSECCKMNLFFFLVLLLWLHLERNIKFDAIKRNTRKIMAKIRKDNKNFLKKGFV